MQPESSSADGPVVFTSSTERAGLVLGDGEMQRDQINCQGSH